MIALVSASAICVPQKRQRRWIGLAQADDTGPTKRSTLLQILVEPLDSLLQSIDLMLGVDEHMAFTRIDN